jgi:flagellar biosynthetic protein FliQ
MVISTKRISKFGIDSKVLPLFSCAFLVKTYNDHMNADIVIGLMMNALKVAVIIAAPMLIFGLVVGLIVSIFQAVTQIQEMTLAFIPKILAIVASVALFLPWMVQIMVTYSKDLIENINLYIGK